MSPLSSSGDTALIGGEVEVESRTEREVQLAQSVARQYLEQTGLTAGAALEALVWSQPQPIIDEETLSADDVAAYQAAEAALLAYHEYAFTLLTSTAFDPPAVSTAHAPSTLPQSAVAAMGERYTAYYEGARASHPDPLGFISDVPEARVFRDRMEAIAQRAFERQETLREDKLTALLTTTRGPAQDPYTWLESIESETVLGVSHTAFLLALERLARQGAEATAAEATADAERAKQESARIAQQIAQRSQRPVQLGDRVVFPQALIESGYHAGGGFGTKLEAISQGDLFAPPDALAVLRQGAIVTAQRTQLAALPRMQAKALVAVYHLFSSAGDNGREFDQHSIRVDAKMLYQAANVDPHNGRACRDLFRALDVLTASPMPLAIKLRGPDNGWSVAATRSPLFEARPIWNAHTDGRRKRSEAEADEIVAAWVKRPASGDAPWEGALPDAYDLELPPIMRMVWHRLALASDILKRFDAGAKITRGKTEGFSGLEWRLLIELTQRTQALQPSESGKTLRSFIDRDALLADYYGAEEVKKARAKGKYHGKYVAQYEIAVRTLEAGKIATRVEQGRPARRGHVRDVFELEPDVVLGLEGRAARASDRLAAKGAGRTSATGAATPTAAKAAKRSTKRSPKP